MNDWINLAETQEEKIKKELEKAFADSIRNPQLTFVVELYNDGTIETLYDNAGSNSFPSSRFKGESICVAHFCNQYFDVDCDSELSEEDWKEWYIDEYASEEAEIKYNEFIEDLEKVANIL